MCINTMKIRLDKTSSHNLCISLRGTIANEDAFHETPCSLGGHTVQFFGCHYLFPLEDFTSSGLFVVISFLLSSIETFIALHKREEEEQRSGLGRIKA